MSTPKHSHRNPRRPARHAVRGVVLAVTAAAVAAGGCVLTAALMANNLWIVAAFTGGVFTTVYLAVRQEALPPRTRPLPLLPAPADRTVPMPSLDGWRTELMPVVPAATTRGGLR